MPALLRLVRTLVAAAITSVFGFLLLGSASAQAAPSPCDQVQRQADCGPMQSGNPCAPRTLQGENVIALEQLICPRPQPCDRVSEVDRMKLPECRPTKKDDDRDKDRDKDKPKPTPTVTKTVKVTTVVTRGVPAKTGDSDVDPMVIAGVVATSAAVAGAIVMRRRTR